MSINLERLEKKLKPDYVWQLKLSCGHTMETAVFTKREKELGKVFCALEKVEWIGTEKPVEILSARQIHYLKMLLPEIKANS